MDIRPKVHVINFSRKLVINAVFFLAPLYFLRVGLNGWQIGVIVSIYSLTPLLVSFPTGWVNDRFAISGAIRLGLGSQAAVLLLIPHARAFPLIALLYLFLGISNSILDVSLNSLYYKDVRDENLNRKFGLLAFWMHTGTATGVLLGGLLLQFTGFRVFFYSLALINLAVFALMGSFGPEKFELVSLRDYRRSFFKPKPLLLTLMLFILALHWGVEGTVYSPFLRRSFGLNSLQLSLYIALALYVMAFSALAMSRLSFNIRLNKRLFLVAMALSGLGLVLMVNRSVYFSFSARALHEAADGALAVLVTVFISRLFDTRTIGGNAGLLQAIFTLGNTAGAQVFSPMGFGLGLQYPFLVAGALLVANSLFGYYVFKKVSY